MKKGGCLLQPPTPIFRADNWSTLEIQKTTLEDLEAAQETYVKEKEAEEAPVMDDANDLTAMMILET